MNVMALLEILDEELNNASSVPLTGKRLVNIEQCLQILSDIRVNLPDDMKRAEKLMAEKQQILADAQEQADRLVDDTQRRMQEMVSDSEILRQARAQAQEIVQLAKKDARELRAGAIQYADDVLSDLENQSQKMLQEIRKNLSELRGMQN